MENKILKARRRKRLVGIALVVLIALLSGFLYFRGREGADGGDGQNVAYVTSVATLTGQYSSNGVFNRYAGTVESQETKSFNKRDDAEIQEIFVETGDEVKEGTPLFSYDNTKYEEDLAKGEIELERQKNELDSIKTTIDQLEKEKKSASSADKANYTVQIQEQQLNLKQQEYDIQSKELELDRIRDNIAHATVTSDMEGVVKSINKDSGSQSYYGGYGGDETENGFIVIMKTGDFRIKGAVNEQNIYDISEGQPVIVHSRLNDQTWRGTVTSIDRENTIQNQNMYGEGSGSSNYPFYVELESSEGLLMGQHVYMEMDYGQGEKREDGLWLDEYMIDMTDPDAPFVWADNGKGKLEKRKILLGTYDEEMMQYKINGGLSTEDSIAFPDESLKEGMKCLDESMRTYDSFEEGMEGMEGMESMEGMEGMESMESMEGMEGMEGMESMESMEGMEETESMEDTEAEEGQF